MSVTLATFDVVGTDGAGFNAINFLHEIFKYESLSHKPIFVL